jgi:hypothetical protein
MHVLKDAMIAIDHMDATERPEDKFSFANDILRWHRPKDT